MGNVTHIGRVPHRYILITEEGTGNVWYACLDCGYVEQLEEPLAGAFKQVVKLFPNECALIGEVLFHG